MGCHRLLSFGRLLSRTTPFLIPELSFLRQYSSIVVGVLRFLIWGVLEGTHLLVSLVATVIGTAGTVPVSICVASAKLYHEGCYGGCYNDLKCSRVHL